MLAHTDTVALPETTVQNDISIEQSRVPFTAACFAGPGKEWSLAPLQKPEDVKANPPLAYKLQRAAKSLDADRLYAPTPVDSNGEIINPAQLSRVFILGGGVVMFRNPAAPADGTLLRDPGDAGIFSAGGCGVIVTTIDDRLIFAHAGRESLIDRARILDDRPRRHESVVDSIMEAYRGLGYKSHQLTRLKAWMFYSIKPEDFLHRYDDTTYGEYNRRVGTDLEARGLGEGVQRVSGGVELDLPLVARARFIQQGVPSNNIHLEHAYLADELPHTRRGGGRYLVAIVRS